MYDNEIRDMHEEIREYVEKNVETGILTSEDFNDAFNRLLETDEEFKKMVDAFNERIVHYGEKHIESVNDYLNIGEKIFPVETEELHEETEEKKEEEPEEELPVEEKVKKEEPKVEKSENSDLKIDDESKKKGIVLNIVKGGTKSIGTSIAVIANGICLSLAGGALVSGMFLGYSAATIASMAAPFLIIPAVTAGVIIIPKLYKNQKIRNLFHRNKNKTEPLPNFENSKEMKKSKEVHLPTETREEVYFPVVEDEETKVDKDFRDVLPEAEEVPAPKTPPKEVEDIVETPKEEREKEPKSDSFNPATDTPVFERKVEKEESPVIEKTEPVTKPIETPINHFEENEYDEPIDNVTYNPSDFDFVKQEPIQKTPEKKEEYKPRHIKKNMQNLEEGYKEKRIAELESEIQRLEDVKRTLNSGHVFREDDDRKTLVERMIRENHESLEKNIAELNELKGVKENNNYELLKSRKEDLNKKLENLADTPENKKIRGNIKAAIGQIDRYIELTDEIKDNKYARDEDREKLLQAENIAYTTSDYVWNDINGYNYVGRRKGK